MTNVFLIRHSKRRCHFLLIFIVSIFALFACADSDEKENDPTPPPAPEPVPEKVIDVPTDTVESVVPSLSSVVFRYDDNPYQLNDDVICDIIDDSLVICRIPNVVENKQLIPDIKFVGEKTLIDNVEYSRGNTFDFQRPVKLTVLTDKESKEYTMYVHSFTGLPVMWIETEGRQDITSKDEYLNASFRLEEGVVTRSPGDIISESVMIKGRGNSSWELFDKKPYRLKFDKKVSLLGEPKDKSWVLIANFNDKTMLRNQISFFVGKLSKLDWTPRAHFVELMLNGKYNGTYLLCEKIKVSKDRVNIGDDGFLMEQDAYAVGESDSRYFSVGHLTHEVNIREPHVEYDDDNFNYAKNFMEEADNALFSDHFTDEETGWRKYFDIDSFVDWYLVNEIVKNADATGWSSVFFQLKRGEKLKMGPIWDFDQSFGNCDYSDATRVPELLYVRWHTWYTQLFKDPFFVKCVKERFPFFYGQKEAIFKEIDANAQYLKYAVAENENRWHTLYTYDWRNAYIWGNYDNEVQFMKQWLNTRLEWLKREYDKM